MWQFIPSTGLHYELKQNLFLDERRDVLASTRAALDYLRQLHGMFGDWHLALAAYNWGEGNVQRAIARNRRAGKPADYSSLRMPNETRHYLPKLQAMKNIVARPEAFRPGAAGAREPSVLPVGADRARHRRRARGAAGQAQPGRVQGAQPADEQAADRGGGHAAGAAALRQRQRLRQGVAAHRGRWSSWAAWTVPKTMKAAEAAKTASAWTRTSCARSTTSRRACWCRPARHCWCRARASATTTSPGAWPTTRLSLSPEGPPRAASRSGSARAATASRRSPGAMRSARSRWRSGTSSRPAPVRPGSTVVVYVPNTKGGPTRVAKASSKKSGKPVRVAASNGQTRKR